MTRLALKSQIKSKRALRVVRNSPKILAAESKKALQRYVAKFTVEMATTRFTGYTGGGNSPEGPLQNRSGTLRRSIFGRVSGRRLNDLKATLFGGGRGASPLYALAQEKGAVIRPVRASRLAIPIGENLTRAGNPRFPSAADFFRQFGSEGSKQVFLVPSKRTPGNTVVMLRTGKDSAAPFFVLTDQVTIPGPESDGSKGRLQFVLTASKLLPFLRTEMRRGIATAIRRARRS